MARYGYNDFNQTNMNVADKQSTCFIYIWVYHLTGISCVISLSFGDDSYHQFIVLLVMVY